LPAGKACKFLDLQVFFVQTEYFVKDPKAKNDKALDFDALNC